MQVASNYSGYGVFVKGTTNVHGNNKCIQFGSFLEQAASSYAAAAAEKKQAENGANRNSLLAAQAVGDSLNNVSDAGNYMHPQDKFLFSFKMGGGEKVYSAELYKFDHYLSDDERLKISEEARAKGLNVFEAHEMIGDRVFILNLEEALGNGGIELAEDEKFNISVDKHYNVTVTGDNKEKAKAIEELLNSAPEGTNWGYLISERSAEKTHAQTGSWGGYMKTLLANYIENESGGTVSLDDLYLENDRIMGLPPELDEIINSIKPDPSMKDLPSFVESSDINSKLKKILAIGVNNIPDLTANAVLEKGKITFS